MSAFYDTFLNVVSFAFIGLLFWLYFKDFPKAGDETAKAEQDGG